MPVDDPEILPQLSRRAAKNSTVVFFGQVFSLVANLGATVLLARYLGHSGFGLFSYALAFVSIFALVADFGMQTIIVRELASRRWNPIELLGNAVFIKIILCLVTIGLTILAAWIGGYSQSLLIIIIILSFNIPVTSKYYTLRTVFEAQFNVSLQMHVPVLFQLFDSLVLIGATYGLVQSGASLEVLALGYLLSNMPGLILILYAATRQVPFRLAMSKKIILFLAKESLPLWIYTIFMTLAGNLDILLLRNLQGDAAVGLYSAALRLTSPWTFIPQAIVASLFPILSHYHTRSEEKLSLAFHLGMKATILVALALAIVTTFLGPQIISFIYTPEYGAAAIPWIILMWSQAFFFMIFFFTSALTSVNQQRVTFHAATAIFLTNALCNWVLIPKLGMQGAALARLFCSVSGLVVLAIAAARIFTLHLRQLLPQVIAIGVFFACGVALLSRVQFGISLVASFGIFLLLVMMSGIFNEKERAVLKSMIPNPTYRK
jgi:O-antigen/teichoic acid export membrane protein